jgi:N-acetyl-gamma-glutamyl-phosphate reductase
LIGTSGMLAGEFLRLAAEHPELEIGGLVSREPGRALSELHPHLVGPATIDEAEATARLRERASAGAAVALVLGLPHRASALAWRSLSAALGEAAANVRVVDLSADYRLRDPALYARWYKEEHPDPAGLAEFVYGLPEIAREPLEGARRVAAPGCFATALQLATWPAAARGWLLEREPWHFSAVTGSSGSGVTPTPGTHHPFRHANLWAYGLEGHRHEAELGQMLAHLGQKPELLFVPHSGPFARGIHLTAMLPLAKPVDAAEARAAYREAYAGRAFVRVLDEAPDLRRVVGSNSAALTPRVRGRTLVVLATLDNLIKGGAGQALQCLNLMFGWPETAGLPRHGLGVA